MKEQYIPEKELMVRPEMAERESIPQQVELEFPIGSVILEKDKKIPFKVKAYDFRYGWVYIETTPDQVKAAKGGDVMVKFKKDESSALDQARDFISGEKIADKDKQWFKNWSESNPYTVILDAGKLSGEKKEILRDISAGDFAEYFNLQFQNPKTGEVIQVVDEDRGTRAFVVRDQLGREKSLAPEELFPTYIMVKEERMPMAGDTYVESAEEYSRMREPVMIKINYSNPKTSKVCFTEMASNKMGIMKIDEFRQKYVFEPL